MRKYRTIARIHLMHSLQYRANLLGGFAMYAMFLFVFFCLWRTIYAAGAPEDYTIAQVIWYLCITELISFGTRTNVFTEIAQDVKNGTIPESVVDGKVRNILRLMFRTTMNRNR